MPPRVVRRGFRGRSASQVVDSVWGSGTIRSADSQKGVRDYCGTPRASGFSRIRDDPFTAKAEICVVVQPESMKAVENVEAAAAIDGVDAFFFGPGDLSADMGYLRGGSCPEVVEVMIPACRRIEAAGKKVGIIRTDEALTRRYIEVGFDIVAVGSGQGVPIRGADDLAAKFR